jgi:hypothetical protein
MKDASAMDDQSQSRWIFTVTRDALPRIDAVANDLRSHGVAVRNDDVLEFTGNIVGVIDWKQASLDELRHVPGILAIEPSGVMTTQRRSGETLG